jgi:hypothetical protein
MAGLEHSGAAVDANHGRLDSPQSEPQELQLSGVEYQKGASRDVSNASDRGPDTFTVKTAPLPFINACTMASVDNIFSKDEVMTADRLKLLTNVLKLNQFAPGHYGSDQGAFTPEQLSKIGNHLVLLAENHPNPKAKEAMRSVAERFCS